jgi:hypothetical protein
MSYILITVSALLVTYGIYRLTRKKVETTNDAQEAEISTDNVVTENVELKVEKVQESAQELKERLETITSTDSEKPFASLSKPTASEIPTEFTKEETESLPETEAPAPKAKKKRPYKKRAPKKEKEIKKED